MQSKMMLTALDVVNRFGSTINLAAMAKKTGIGYDWLLQLSRGKTSENALNLELFLACFDYDVEIKHNDKPAGTVTLKNDLVDMEAGIQNRSNQTD